MPFDIQVEDLDGIVIESLGDLEDTLPRLLPDIDDHRFCLLRFVDVYGHTVFNEVQMNELSKELSLLQAERQSPEEQRILDQLVHLINRGLERPNRLLRFIGD